jgi:hypothetical protein
LRRCDRGFDAGNYIFIDGIAPLFAVNRNPEAAAAPLSTDFWLVFAAGHGPGIHFSTISASGRQLTLGPIHAGWSRSASLRYSE